MILPAGDKDEVQRHPDHQQAASSMLYTTSCKQSSAPEDGRNYRPKHVELIEIIYKIFIVASSWLFILFDISIFLGRPEFERNI